MRSAPLRFLAAVLLLWVCARAAILAPGWWGSRGDTPRLKLPAAAAPPPQAKAADIAIDSASASLAPTTPPIASPPARRASTGQGHRLIRDVPYEEVGRLPLATPNSPDSDPALVAGECCTLSAPAGLGMAAPLASAARPLVPRGAGAGAAGRWSGSAWLLVRRDPGGPALAPGGTLGGSQAGARLLYRAGDGLALSARAYAPLRRPAGAEAALGIDWRPLPRLPFRLLAERRQALGGDGRSAFALTLYGGTARKLPLGLRLEAWGQAGLVGTRSRDLFADGAVRVSVPLGPVEVGGGAWGAAQPGASRMDAGPTISWRLPIARANLRLSADWRFRLAGDAVPGSGPAFTLATGF